MVAIIKRAISALNLRLNMALSFKTIYLLLPLFYFYVFNKQLIVNSIIVEIDIYAFYVFIGCSVIFCYS